MNNMKNKLDKLTVPIIQGGMGVGVSMSGLAGAVAREGGMGVISSVNAGYKKPRFDLKPKEMNLFALEEEIKRAREIAEGNGLIAVNIMTAVTGYEETCRTAIEAGADAIISGAGLPLKLAEIVAEAREQNHSEVMFAPIVSGKRAAELLCRQYSRKQGVVPDFLILEGAGAGGHLGFSKEELLGHTAKSNEELLEEILEVLRPYEEQYGRKIPVYVAGGVYDGADIRRFMKLGAAGVQMATRFIATEECDASDGLKEMLIQAKKEDIVIIQSPVGMPARAINSPLLKRLREGEKFLSKRCNGCLTGCKRGDQTPYCISRALIEAVNGNKEDGLFFCGENAWRVDRIQTVKELIQELMEE